MMNSLLHPLMSLHKAKAVLTNDYSGKKTTQDKHIVIELIDLHKINWFSGCLSIDHDNVDHGALLMMTKLT